MIEPVKTEIEGILIPTSAVGIITIKNIKYIVFKDFDDVKKQNEGIKARLNGKRKRARTRITEELLVTIAKVARDFPFMNYREIAKMVDVSEDTIAHNKKIRAAIKSVRYIGAPERDYQI